MTKKCPRCGSTNLKMQGYIGIETIRCYDCKFDESKVYDVFPDQKSNQKAKGSFSPYKTGGSQRTRKK